ncbi:unnamed protein product [Rotaria sp. Silwood1]|nr:unnamed protein product [Rotaria sp. Silwood1]
MKNNSFDEVKIQFEKFLSLIRNVLTSENEINIIQNKLRRHFNTTTSDYLCSNEFILSLNHIHNIFVENKKSVKYFTLLASFDEQLKKHSIKLSRSNSLSTQISECLPSMITTIETNSVNEIVTTTVPSNISKSTIEYETSITDVQEVINHLVNECCNTLSESTSSKKNSVNNIISTSTHSNHDSKHQRKIIKLERRLQRLSRIIRELEEKDMSLDEMAHCDLYVVESNLKKQACEIHNKLAKLKSQPLSIERIIHRPIVLNESEIGHSLIQKDLQEMIFEEFSKIEPDPEAEINIESTEAEESINENNDKDESANENNEQNQSSVENNEQEETQTIVEPHEIQYDIVDLGVPSSPEPINQNLSESNSIETTLEISLNDRALTILSTASLPIKRTIHNRESEIYNNIQSSSATEKDSNVETLIPRRKPNLADNEIIYSLYKQRLTNNVSTTSPQMTKKRQSTINTEYTNVKKGKQQQPQSEIIVLD